MILVGLLRIFFTFLPFSINKQNKKASEFFHALRLFFRYIIAFFVLLTAFSGFFHYFSAFSILSVSLHLPHSNPFGDIFYPTHARFSICNSKRLQYSHDTKRYRDCSDIEFSSPILFHNANPTLFAIVTITNGFL